MLNIWLQQEPDDYQALGGVIRSANKDKLSQLIFKLSYQPTNNSMCTKTIFSTS